MCGIGFLPTQLLAFSFTKHLCYNIKSTKSLFGVASICSVSFSNINLIVSFL